MVLSFIGIVLFIGAVACFVLASRSFGRKGTLPKIIGVLCVSAGVAVTLSAAQIIVTSQSVLRVTDIFYYASIDILMFALYSYTAELAGVLRNLLRTVGVFFVVLIAIDIVLFILNVFFPVMASYVAMTAPGFGVTAGLTRSLMPAFYYHLGIDYAMAAASGVLFVVKIRRTSSIYRGPYIGLLCALVIILTINVLYMVGIIKFPTDCSCMIFALAVYCLYWASFHTLRNSQYGQVVKTIVQGTHGPVVCFADNGCLTVMNEAAKELFDVEENDWNPITLSQFAQRFGMPDLPGGQDDLSFVWSPYSTVEGSYLCEFAIARDEGGFLTGYGITMRKATEAMDSKTGLRNEESFRERRNEIDHTQDYPAVFANICLSYVMTMNDAYGRCRTDESIARFARYLSDCWPQEKGSFLAYRGASEFELISHDLSCEQVKNALDKLKEEIEWDLPDGIKGDFEYGIMEADGVDKSALVASRTAHELCMYKLYASQDSVKSNSVSALVRPLIDRGFTTQGRIDSTSHLAGRIAKKMDVDEIVYWRCVLLARLSDIGKLAMPDDVAFHSGAYTRGARMLMERHVEVGYRLLRSTTGLSALAKPLLFHHENWDGSGYPDNLKGTQIPLESRIIAVACAFDDLVNDASHPLSLQDAVEEIAAGAGTMFDPDVVRALLDVAADEEGLVPAAKTVLLGQMQRNLEDLERMQNQSEPERELTVLVVDDEEMNRAIIAMNLAGKYKCVEATNGQEALDLLSDSPGTFDIVLLDLIMPVLNGHEVLKRAHEAKLVEEIPFIVVTADDEVETWKSCLDMGAAEVLAKPVNGDILRRRVDNAVELFSTRKSLQLKVEEQSADIMIKNEELKAQANRLVHTNEQVSTILHNVMDYRDCDSAGHLDRVVGFTMLMAAEVAESYPSLGIRQDQVETLGQAAALHDIGKVAIPDSILFKVGRLTEDEFSVMKAHTVCGYNLILKPLQELGDDDFARFSLEIVRSHHERWDGAGYPDGLKEREIPVSAQIAALADVYDALTSKRPYKEPCSHEVAVETILAGGCGAFSDVMIDVFKKVSPEFPALAQEYADAQDLNFGTEYRERLVKSCGDLDAEGVEIDNGSSMEHVVHMLMEANRELRLVNQYDLPTGAFNRNAYVEFLRNFDSSNVGCMAAVYFDVNGLHEYNRDFGHAQGDIMLANVARAIMDVFGDFKTFRTGGDEFVSVCENATEEETNALVQEVQATFADRGLACSVGYDWRQSDIDMGEMVKAADRSMFAQKTVYYEQNPHVSQR